MFFRLAIQNAPRDQPQQAQAAGHQKHRSPIVELAVNEQYQRWANRGPNTRTAIKQCHSPGTLLGWKPFGDSLGRAWIVGRFATSQQETEKAQRPKSQRCGG